jgi:hypothetical protein
MRLNRLALMLAFSACAVAFSAGASRAQDTPAPAPAATATNPPLPSPQPTAEDPKVRKVAIQQFLAWQQGTIDRSLYSDAVNADLTDEVMDRGTKTLANLGALEHAVFRGVSHARGALFYVYRMQCEHGAVDMEFAFGPDGRIGLIFFE